MRLLFDQNISSRILKNLPISIFEGSSHVKKEGLINSLDKEIWEYAKNNDFTIVTQDSDFSDLNLLCGFPPKILWIRTGNIKTVELTAILLHRLSEIETFVNSSDYGCFEIISIRRKH